MLAQLHIPTANWELIDRLHAARKSVLPVSSDTVFVAGHPSYTRPLLAGFDVSDCPNEGSSGLFINLDPVGNPTAHADRLFAESA
jgi:hypothetical protein